MKETLTIIAAITMLAAMIMEIRSTDDTQTKATRLKTVLLWVSASLLAFVT